MVLRVIVASCALLLLAGCGGSPDAEAPNPAPSAPTSTPQPVNASAPAPIATRCTSVNYAAKPPREVTFRTRDGVELYAAEVGAGARGVVLLPGTSPAGLCNWAEVLPALAGDGYHALALDHRCQGGSGCDAESFQSLDLDVIAAVAELRKRGARTVTVMGESRGGAVALAAAARPDFDGDAVVAVSGVWFDGSYTGPDPAPLATLVRRITVPTLYLSSRGEGHVDQAEYRSWERVTKRGEYVTVPGSEHGAQLFGIDGIGPLYRRSLTPFLARVSDQE